MPKHPIPPPLSPLPVADAPDPVEAAYAPLLAEPVVRAYAAPDGVPGGLRERLLRRAVASSAAARPMTTSRATRLPALEPAPGVRATTLYAADASRPLRAGEPQSVRLVELAPGARWTGPGAGRYREWLVLRGRAVLGTEALGERDYHVQPRSEAGLTAGSDTGALLFLRESAVPEEPGDAGLTVRDAEAGWPDYAPGIRRRVLWQRGAQAAMLYHAQPGASVPPHHHGHDEECLMVQGELYLDDVLLQAGDYQLAPAGTGHRVTATDTGVVVYAHGDLDLRFVAEKV